MFANSLLYEVYSTLSSAPGSCTVAFADDCTILVSTHSDAAAQDLLGKAMGAVSEWARDNEIVVHTKPGKTSLLVFHSQRAGWRPEVGPRGGENPSATTA